MRIDVHKFLFVGVEEDRTLFFQRAQELGVIQFIDPKGAHHEIPPELQATNEAIKVVRSLEPSEQFDGEETIIPEILALKKKEEALIEEINTIKLEIARIHVYGDFSLEDMQALEPYRKMQFFCAKEGKMPSPELIYVGSDQGLDYYVSLSKEIKSYEGMVELVIEESLGTLQKRLRGKELELHQTELTLRKYSRYNTYLHQILIDQLNRYHLERAKECPDQVMDSLFSVEGWIPTDKTSLISELTEGLRVHSEEIAIEEREVVPTYLENKGISEIGEDLVHLYDTPSPTDKDPSLWVLAFFSLFYAMIIGDAGYGFLFLIGALFIFRRTTKISDRFKKLVYILCGACIAWGMLINSFFGLQIAPESPLRKISLLQWLVNKKANHHLSHEDQVYREWLVKFPEIGKGNNYTHFLGQSSLSKDGKQTFDILNTFSDNILMEIALLVGTLHVCLSLARYMGRNWAAAGWILAIMGGYLYLPYYLKVTSIIHFVFGLDPAGAAASGKILFMVGITLAVIMSIIQNGWSGLLEITLVIQIFSDILSYLRLYALGLAGGIISVTVNEIAMAIPMIFGVVILIIGHAINMGLAIIGGVIHGLRLNFLE